MGMVFCAEWQAYGITIPNSASKSFHPFLRDNKKLNALVN